MPRALVIGAGINGILTAKALQNNGFDVDILDCEPQSGMRATFANGCQLSFSHTTPMNIQPSFFSKPFYKPSFLPKEQKNWLLQHQRSKINFEQRFSLLTELALESKQAFDKIFKKHSNLPAGIGHSSGTAYIFSKKSQFEWRKNFFEKQKNKYNIHYKCFDTKEATECDDAFVKTSGVQGLIFTPLDKTLNAIAFTKFMENEFLNDGGRVFYNTSATEIQHKNGVVSAVQTNTGMYFGYDFYIYTGGAFGLNLLQDFNLNLQPVTGYSLTFDVSYSNYCPQVNVIDFTNKVVYSRHEDILRVAGFFDLLPPKNKEKRIKMLYSTAVKTFPILKRQKLIHTWFESRVFTYNEEPVVQKISENFVINTAHGHLGITLSAGSASKIASLLLSN
jgi:D-amino-acid dehydrogenase